jgi:hypothetical protein
VDEHLEALEKLITELKIDAELRGAELDTCQQICVRQANEISRLRIELDALKAAANDAGQ